MKKRNRKSFGQVINWQKTHVIQVDPNKYNGEASPYWDWVQDHAERNEDGECKEFPQANPDVLPYKDDYENRRWELQEKIEDLLEILSPREKQVWNLLEQEKDEQEIACILGIKRTVVKNYRQRIKNKFDRLGDIEA